MPRESRTAEEIVDELYSKVIPVSDCLECHLVASSDRANRERHYVQVGGRAGIKWKVTRLVWTYKRGPIPEGLFVLHTCDNPKCIKIEHLFLGTAQDDTDDMIAKGRKVDDPDVGRRRREWTAKRIKPLFEQGLTKYQIAARLYISPATVRNYISPKGVYYVGK